MKLHFSKLHGAGNDYLYFNCMHKEIDNAPILSQKISDRHFGVGSDGIILILPSTKADFRMRMFNADGSESEMCGNGIRGFAKYVHDKGLTTKTMLNVETGRGVLSLELFLTDGKVNRVKVDMGEPILEGHAIPTTIHKSQVVNETLNALGRDFTFTSVSMGNPHCIIYVDEITDDLVHKIGPIIEKHSIFPRKVNVEFIKINSKDDVTMRVWERGSGETLACGTGASAVCVAGVLTGRTNRNVKIHLLGGDLDIEWAENNHVYMTGPAAFVFDGEFEA